MFRHDEWVRLNTKREVVANITERGRFHWFITERFVCESVNDIESRDLSFEEFLATEFKPTHPTSGRGSTLIEAQEECDDALILLGFEFVDPKLLTLK